jgi:hypothetical protein
MANSGYKQGETLLAVMLAEKSGTTLQELSRITGKSRSAIRSSGGRIGIKLKSEFNRAAWGSVKSRLHRINTAEYTCGEVAQMLDASKYTIYSLCTRDGLPLKKAEYGSQKHVRSSANG